MVLCVFTAYDMPYCDVCEGCVSRCVAMQVFAEVERAMDSLPSKSGRGSARVSTYEGAHGQEDSLAAA